MIAAILAAFLTMNGTPAKAYGNVVVLTERPGCTAQALHNDPTRPVIVCHPKAM